MNLKKVDVKKDYNIHCPKIDETEQVQIYVIFIQKDTPSDSHKSVFHATLNTPYFHPKIVKINGCWVYSSGLKYLNSDKHIEFLIVASYTKTDEALRFYRQRWQIETMFKAFKTTGFNLEDTHLTDYQRLDKLLMLTALAFTWAYKAGIYRDKNIKKIIIKKHGTSAKSVFKYGLEWLAQVLINAFSRSIQTITSAFLSCTQNNQYKKT